MKFVSLICRCRDEYFIQEFCDYYLKQGVDTIYILDDESTDQSIYDFKSQTQYSDVKIIKCKRQYEHATTINNELNVHDETNKLYKSIRTEYEWVIYVDVDEFITTKKNSNLTIREQLKEIDQQHSHISCILVPWVIMSGLHHKTNPKSVLQSILYRQSQDIRHPYHKKKFDCRYDSTFCKSIFKPIYEHVKDHGPVSTSPEVVKYNSVDLTTKNIDNFTYKRLRECDIERGYFMCYHYRYISEQHAITKLQTYGWYINDGYTLKDLQTSYPEIYDCTFLNK